MHSGVVLVIGLFAVFLAQHTAAIEYAKCREHCVCDDDLQLLSCDYDPAVTLVDLRPSASYPAKLLSVASDVFAPYSSLTNVSLADNALFEVDDATFALNAALRFVDLRNNRLTFLTDALFAGVASKSALTLLLSGNPAVRSNQCGTPQQGHCVAGHCSECVCTSPWRGPSCSVLCNSTSVCCPGHYLAASTAQCDVCPRGHFCTGDGLARACATGHYQPSLRRDRCVPCPFGSFANGTGSVACSVCPAQHVCPSGASAPLPLALPGVVGASSTSMSSTQLWPSAPASLAAYADAVASAAGFYAVVGALSDLGAADDSFDWDGVARASWAFAVLVAVVVCLAAIAKVRSRFFKPIDVAFDYSHRVAIDAPQVRRKAFGGGLALVLVLACAAILIYMYVDLYANGDGLLSLALVDDVTLLSVGYTAVPFGARLSVAVVSSSPSPCAASLAVAGFSLGTPSLASAAAADNGTCVFELQCPLCAVLQDSAASARAWTSPAAPDLASDGACLRLSLMANTSLAAMSLGVSLYSSNGAHVQDALAVVAAGGRYANPPLDPDGNGTSTDSFRGVDGGALLLASRRFVVDHFRGSRSRTGLRVGAVSWAPAASVSACAALAATAGNASGVIYIAIDAGDVTAYQRVVRAETPQTLAAQIIATLLALGIAAMLVLRAGEAAAGVTGHASDSVAAKYQSHSPDPRGSFYESRRLYRNESALNAFANGPPPQPEGEPVAVPMRRMASLSKAKPPQDPARLTRRQTKERLLDMNEGVPVKIESLEDAMEVLAKDRRAAGRPAELRDMTPQEMFGERLSIKTILYEYEAGFKEKYGRELTKPEKEHMRPLYRRYRMLRVTGSDTAGIDEDAQTAAARWRIAAVKGRAASTDTFSTFSLHAIRAAQDIYAEELREMSVLDPIVQTVV